MRDIDVSSHHWRWRTRQHRCRCDYRRIIACRLDLRTSTCSRPIHCGRCLGMAHDRYVTSTHWYLRQVWICVWVLWVSACDRCLIAIQLKSRREFSGWWMWHAGVWNKWYMKRLQTAIQITVKITSMLVRTHRCMYCQSVYRFADPAHRSTGKSRVDCRKAARSRHCQADIH